MQAAGRGNLKKVSLELGGKSPTLIFDDAQLEAAVGGTALASFFNQGQVCTAGSRVYAHKRVFDDVASGLADNASSIHLGSGLAAGTTMGPLVSREQFEKVSSLIESDWPTAPSRWPEGGRSTRPATSCRPPSWRT